FARLKSTAQAAGIGRIVSFGERADADARLMKVSLQADTSTVQAVILGHDVTYKLGAPGRHMVDNSLGILAASHLLGADLALAAAVLANGVDLVYCSGPLMKSLWDALPSERRGGYADNSAALEPDVLSAVTAGDAVMIKGSLGSRMGRIVKALQQRSARAEAQ